MFDTILEDLCVSKTEYKLSTTELNADLNMIEFFSSHPALSKVCSFYMTNDHDGNTC